MHKIGMKGSGKGADFVLMPTVCLPNDGHFRDVLQVFQPASLGLKTLGSFAFTVP